MCTMMLYPGMKCRQYGQITRQQPVPWQQQEHTTKIMKYTKAQITHIETKQQILYIYMYMYIFRKKSTE